MLVDRSTLFFRAYRQAVLINAKFLNRYPDVEDRVSLCEIARSFVGATIVILLHTLVPLAMLSFLWSSFARSPVAALDGISLMAVGVGAVLLLFVVTFGLAFAVNEGLRRLRRRSYRRAPSALSLALWGIKNRVCPIVTFERTVR